MKSLSTGPVPPKLSFQRSEGGFTLIELIAVVLIIGLIVGLSATRLDFLVPKYRLRQGAREMAGVIKQGKARAAATGKDTYFEVDLSQGQYWLLVAFTKPLEDGQIEEQLPVEKRPVEYQPVFQRALPDGVEFMDVIFSEKDKVASGRARVRLSAFGATTHTIINLKNKDDREIAVKFNGFTGMISFYDHHKDADELVEDSGP